MHEGHRQRLRDSYLKNGAETFHDHQLLELLLTFSVPRRDTNPLAHTLLTTFGSLQDVLNADAAELMQIDGVGESTAVLLSLVGNVPPRLARKKTKTIRLSTPHDAMTYCSMLFSRERYEAMYILSLDKSMRVLYAEKLSSGTLTETAIYPRLVVESALRHNAYSVVLAHNHPSGDIRPSKEDLDTTEIVLRALEPIGIRLYDHLIIGGDSVFSMARDSLMPQSDGAQTLASVAENPASKPGRKNIEGKNTNHGQDI